MAGFLYKTGSNIVPFPQTILKTLDAQGFLNYDTLMQRNTFWYEKLLASIINTFFVALIFIPLSFLTQLDWRILLVLVFFGYNLFFLIFNKNRCLGMIVLKTHWKDNHSYWDYLIFIILYTLSFSTLLFYIFFPLDLFLINMIFFQIPTVILKKTTLHGFLSGNMVGIKNI